MKRSNSMAANYTVIKPTRPNDYQVLRDNGVFLECIHETASEAEAIIMASGHPSRCYVYLKGKREFNNWRAIPQTPEGDTP